MQDAQRGNSRMHIDHHPTARLVKRDVVLRVLLEVLSRRAEGHVRAQIFPALNRVAVLDPWIPAPKFGVIAADDIGPDDDARHQRPRVTKPAANDKPCAGDREHETDREKEPYRVHGPTW